MPTCPVRADVDNADCTNMWHFRRQSKDKGGPPSQGRRRYYHHHHHQHDHDRIRRKNLLHSVSNRAIRDLTDHTVNRSYPPLEEELQKLLYIGALCWET